MAALPVISSDYLSAASSSSLTRSRRLRPHGGLPLFLVPPPHHRGTAQLRLVLLPRPGPAIIISPLARRRPVTVGASVLPGPPSRAYYCLDISVPIVSAGHGPPPRGETATILYPGAPLKLQPFCYSGDRYNILPALLRARHGNYNLFFKKGSHRLNWQFARPIRRNFAILNEQKVVLPCFIMVAKSGASLFYNGDNYTLLRHALHAVLSTQRTD